MDDNTAEKREETIAALNAALAELEGGEGLSLFTGGHGLMSRRFEFGWSEPTHFFSPSLPLCQYIDIISGARSRWDENLSWIIG